MIENWHRLILKLQEAEQYIVKLYEDSIAPDPETGKPRYNSVNDMTKKTGIRQPTLERMIKAAREREELGVIPGYNLTYTDFNENRVLEGSPEVRKRLLELRDANKISRDELGEYAKCLSSLRMWRGRKN